MKKYNKLIINNLKCSFRNNIFIYFLFVVLILLSCIYLKNGVMHGKSVGAGDYYFNIIKGVEKIDSNKKSLLYILVLQYLFHILQDRFLKMNVIKYLSYMQEQEKSGFYLK